MNGHEEFEELQLLGFAVTPVNVDKELITVFAGALVVVLGIVVTVIKLFLRSQAEALEKIARSNEKVGDTLAIAVREQTMAQTAGANETRLVLAELQLGTVKTHSKLDRICDLNDSQVKELKSLNSALDTHDRFARDSISDLKRQRTDK